MSKSEISIREVEPMRVASMRVISESPEGDVWTKLKSWAKPKGLLDDLEKHPIFGFDNPLPSKESKTNGYELWIKMGPEIESDDQVEIKEFPGGLYAVYMCEVKGDPYKTIPAGWKVLQNWLKSSDDYTCGHHQWLEKSVNIDVTLDDLKLELHLPIRKK
jgi:DNA gyrase inhibitor GyrI